MKKRIVIFGYYGTNFGDLIMLDALVSQLRDHYDVSIVSYAKRPDYTYHTIPDVTFYYLPEYSFWGKIKLVTGLARKSAIFAWGGGTCFFDGGGTGAVKHFLLGYLCGVKIYYFGIGVGRCEKWTTKFNILVAYKLSKKVYVRDGRSFDIFSKMGNKNLFVCDDMVTGFSTVLPRSNSKDVFGKYILVAYRDISEFFGSEKNSQCIDDLCSSLWEYLRYEHDCSVLVMATDREVDLQSAEKIYHKLCGIGRLRLVDSPKLCETIDHIISAKFVVTGRLHVAHFSYLNRVPFYLINYSPKNSEFVRQKSIEFCLVEPAFVKTLKVDHIVSEFAHHYSEAVSGQNVTIDFSNMV